MKFYSNLDAKSFFTERKKIMQEKSFSKYLKYTNFHQFSSGSLGLLNLDSNIAINSAQNP